jgi:hypothetical protein
MKSKPYQRVDKLLAELGLPPDALDPDEAAAGLEAADPPAPIRLTGPCGKTCYTSKAKTRKAGNRIKSHGANTSFFRSYFCPECKAWHLTSGINQRSKQSSQPKRNAGRKRRNPNQPPSSDVP